MTRWLIALVFTVCTPAAAAERLALLVGVSEYPSLARERQLHGPVNDMPLVRRVLEQRGFEPKNIEVIADGVPRASALPTRANILAALDRLAGRARTGDFIFLYFAGHGSQQPTRDLVREPDGASEIFLPRDVGRWAPRSETVENAIVDHEFVQRLDAMTGRGAFVWAVFDACHSATLMRSLGEAVPGQSGRYIAPAELGVPPAPATRSAAAGAVAGREAAPLPGVSSARGRFVAFYAAQTDELANELPLPGNLSAGHPDKVVRGLFGYTLMEAISALPPGATYRQLAQHVLTRFAAAGYGNRQTPLFSGDALDAPVFGDSPGERIQQWPVGRDLTLDAGALHGIGEGAVFAILSGPTASLDSAIGHARLAKPGVLRSVLVPATYAGKVAIIPERIGDGAYARLVESPVSFQIRVALPRGAGQAGRVRHIVQGMRGGQKGALPVTWTDRADDADLRLVVEGDMLWFAPRGAPVVREGPAKTHSLPLAGDDAALGSRISGQLRVMARAMGLMKLAGTLANDPVSRSLEARVELMRAGESPRTIPPSSVPRLRQGDQLWAEMRNSADHASDVTVLYLDSAYGITVVYPRRAGDANRIERNATLRIELGRISERTVGTERLLVIAARAQPNRSAEDFGFLAQPAIERARSAAASEAVRLLADAGYGGSTRSLAGAAAPIGVRVFAWRVGE